MELWDLYDGERRPLGRTHRRGDEMYPGECHVVVGIWVVNNKKEILATLRSPDKETFPDKWENTEGSVLAGETSMEGAVRELHEETGIIASERELIPLGALKEEFAFIDIYLLRRDISISELTMQEGETVAAKWVTLEQLEEMAADGSLAAPVARRFALFKDKIMANL